MASSSHKICSSQGSSKPDDYDGIYVDDDYESGRNEVLEKSLTNFSISISKMMQKLDELSSSYNEFAENFALEQKYLRDELRLLRTTADQMKKLI